MHLRGRMKVTADWPFAGQEIQQTLFFVCLGGKKKKNFILWTDIFFLIVCM